MGRWWLGGRQAAAGRRVPCGGPGRARAGAAWTRQGSVPGGIARSAARSPLPGEGSRQPPGTARSRRGRGSNRAAVPRGCRSGGRAAGAARRRRQQEQPRTARRSPAGAAHLQPPSPPVPGARCSVLAPRRGPAAAVAASSAPPVPPARRRTPAPSPAGAAAAGSAAFPGPGPRRAGRSPWLAPPSPSSQSARLFSMAPAARGRTLLPGSSALRAAASRVPRRPPPPAAAGGRGLQCGGARAHGSLPPAERSPAARFITYAGGIAPAAAGRGAEAGEGAERSGGRGGRGGAGGGGGN